PLPAGRCASSGERRARPSRSRSDRVRPRLVVLGVPPEVWADALESLRKITSLGLAATASEADSLLPAAEVVVLADHVAPWLEKNWEHASKLQWIQSSSTG